MGPLFLCHCVITLTQHHEVIVLRTMGKHQFTEKNWRKDPWFRALCGAFAACNTPDGVADLLRDVATLSELQAMSERMEVAKQLSRGLTYRQVAANTGASTTTVTRVAKAMSGGEGGYERFLRSDKQEKTKQRFETTESALRKYV